MAEHPREPKIVSDPEIRGGEPCFSGTRIPVAMILHWMSEGWDEVRIIAEYPCLTGEDISAGLRFAADRLTSPHLAAERSGPWRQTLDQLSQPTRMPMVP